MRVLSIVASIALALVAPTRALATPGPDSVAVLANADVPGSVALAQQYAAARDVPDRQVCALSMPATEDITLDQFRTLVRAPLEQCLTDAGVLDRIEAIVIARGVPMRVALDVGGQSRRVSLAAALGLWRTTLDDGTEVLGQDPGRMVDCGGTPCLAAAWASGYDGGPFRAGYERSVLGVTHRPMLVTMLHARTDADAAMLIDASLASDGMGAGAGELLFMEGADPARGALDREYDPIVGDLTRRGLTASRVPFASDLTGLTLAAFFTGTASLGTTIEGNTFVPGALADNLTSFGAVPENFRESGESQVSIARWVARGITGVHGTTDEPLNNCFPSRRLILDYVAGATLAESFFGRMPYVYWHNLVIGDPMAAPYAERPEVEVALDGISLGDPIPQGTAMSIDVTTAPGRVIADVSIYVDGIRVDDGTSIPRSICLGEGTPDATATDRQVLVVATLEPDLEGDRRAAKGWTAFRADFVAGDGTCIATASDAGAGPDGSRADAGIAPPASSSGCSCRVASRSSAAPLALVLALALAIAQRKRR